MNWCLLLLMDGRDEYHERSIKSAKEHLPDPPHVVQVNDDSHELGYAGAIAQGWGEVLATGADWVFHLEADFIFNGPVDLERMAAVMERHTYLAQIVLKRGPVNEQEQPGLVERWPNEYTQITEVGDVWTEHRLNWSTNPTLYPVGWCAQGWPQVEGSERAFSDRLLEDPNLRFAYWGAKFDPPRVEHIGHKRIGTGY